MREGICDLEAESIEDAKAQIEELTRDSFLESDETHSVEVLDENGKDIEDKIQAYCPNLN